MIEPLLFKLCSPYISVNSLLPNIKAEKEEEIIAFVILIARHIFQVKTWSSGLTLSQQRSLALFVFQLSELVCRNHDPVHLCGLSRAHHGEVSNEGAGQVVARDVRQVFRLPVPAQREVLLAGEQALLQIRLFQVSNVNNGH